MNMTWKQFKQLVDDELRRQDLTEDIEITYIDVHGSDDDIVVVDDECGQISIF